MLVDFEYIFFLVNLLALKFVTHVSNIELISFQNSMVNKQFFCPWEGVKVGP